MKFGEAVEHAQQGKLIMRQGWDGKNMFVFIQPADELTIDMIVNTVKSLPASVIEYYQSVGMTEGNTFATKVRFGAATKIRFGAYLCMKAADESIVNGWLPSQTDMLADDWQHFE